eukprot:gnl/MRDRNA2_/MRDRNA2_126011_c0_seq1.p1 gnl/MRDRNA2_/MRDRNA2_126011_c0~~gnl/MRDRNA2_/MRDRNA2_126011_c0_seq1.p1  ORF type:complete len:424 (-),score=78.25 gnl/MRDRNA2_/MRDRNA2_126011_c0_seq1:9-1280(-)
MTRSHIFQVIAVLGYLTSVTALKVTTESEIAINLLSSSSDLTPTEAKVAVSTSAEDDPMQRVLMNIAGVPVKASQLVYGCSIALMFGIVMVLYYYKGVFTILRILSYLSALSTITLTIKNIYANYGYNYPKIVSFAHFAACGAVCFSIMAYKTLKKGDPFPVPTLKEQLTGIVPVAAGFAMGIGFNNMALVYAGAGFVEMIGSTTLLSVVVLTVLMGKRFNLAFTWPLLVVGAGVCMCATGELRFSTLGIMFAFGANFMRALKGVLQQHLLCPDSDSGRTKLEPHELLAWMSLPSMAIMLGWSLAAEGIAPFADFASHTHLLGLIAALIVSCANAVILNISNLFLTKDLGALGVNVAGQLKGILIILGAVAVMGERVQFMQILGYAIIVLGAAWYNNVEKAELEAVKKEEAPLLKQSKTKAVV